MKLCVALDLESFDENIKLAKELKEFDLWMKVGFRSYIRDGKKILQELKDINPNFKIFLDLKLYDIPNTMADASYEIAKLGVDMFNVHASSGKRALKTVMERLSTLKNPPIVLAVTALTSFDEEEFRNIYNVPLKQKAKEFAKDSFDAKLNGVVCSAYESLEIKKETSEKFLTLTPGIRPFDEDANDQQRVANIEFAKKQKVDFIVVGRPIYKSPNPKEAVSKILNLISKKS